MINRGGNEMDNQITDVAAENAGQVAAAEAAVNVIPEKKGITGSTLKLIAIGTMLIDHTAAVVIDSFLNRAGMNEAMTSGDVEKIMEFNARYAWLSVLDSVMRCIGRLAFPIFIFLLVQGFMHTHSKAKYAFRLFLFALISEIPFNLALTGHAFSAPFKGVTFGYQSVFWTLLAGFLFMCFADFVSTKKIPTPLGVLASIVMVAASGFTLSCGCNGFINGFISVESTLTGGTQDYEALKAEALKVQIVLMVLFAIGVIIFFTIYCIKNSYEKGCVLAVSLIGLNVLMLAASFGNTDYGMWGVLAIAMAYAFRKKNTSSLAGSVIVLTIMNFIEAFAFIDLIFIKKYNGKRGLSLKYVFYAFYPVHLFLLYTISWFMGCQPGKFLGF